MKIFTAASNKAYTLKCLVFFVDSDEDAIKKVDVICKLFSKVTKPFLSRSGVAGRPHLVGEVLGQMSAQL